MAPSGQQADAQDYHNGHDEGALVEAQRARLELHADAQPEASSQSHQCNYERSPNQSRGRRARRGGRSTLLVSGSRESRQSEPLVSPAKQGLNKRPTPLAINVAAARRRRYGALLIPRDEVISRAYGAAEA